MKPAKDKEHVELRQFARASVIAAKLGIHPKTVFRWADQGLIHRHKINQRLVLFDVAEVARFIAGSRC
jgi:hypothetical protein